MWDQALHTGTSFGGKAGQGTSAMLAREVGLPFSVAPALGTRVVFKEVLSQF